MGLFGFLGKSKRQREIDKIIEKSKEYQQQGQHYYAYVELKNIIYGETEDDKSYRKDEVAALYAESRKVVRGERRRDLKIEAEETAAVCCEKTVTGGITEGETLYKTAKQLDLGDKKPKDETEAARWQKQMEEAYSWYEKAAEKGCEEAILRYAKMNEKGIGTACNKEKAFLLYQKLAQQGSIEGKYELAGCYYFGKGVTGNIKKALELYEEAAQQGHANAQEMCGYMYLYGYGNYVDYEKAYRWYKKSEQNDKTVTNSWYKKEKELRKGREAEELKKDKKDLRIEKAKQLIAEKKYHNVLTLLENDYYFCDYDDPVAGYRFEDAEELYLLCEDTIAEAAKMAEWQAGRELYIATYGEDPWAQADTDDDKEEEETELDREWRLHRESLLEKYDKVYGFEKRDNKFPVFRWGKSAEQWFEEGKKYFDYGEDKTEIARALECYEKAAMMGHQRAMSRCEELLFEIEGYKSEKSEFWMYKKRQFEDGDSICSDAMHAAHRAEYDHEIRRWREARQLLRKAIDLNNSDAMIEYAIMYFTGQGIPGDKRVGYYWMEKAAKVSTQTEVYKSLVSMYFNDMDSPLFDRQKALYWARKAAFGGDAEMMLMAAVLYNTDTKNPSDIFEGLAWAEKAANAGIVEAMRASGVLCMQTAKLRRALNWLEKAAKLGDKESKELAENLREYSENIPSQEEAPPPPPKPITAEEEAKFEPERMATAGERWVKAEPSEQEIKPEPTYEITSQRRAQRSGHFWLPPEDSETTIPENGEYPVTAEYRAEMNAQAEECLKEMVEQYGVSRLVHELWKSDIISCSCFREDGMPLVLTAEECYCKDIIAEMEYRWGCLIYYVVDMGNELYMFAVHNDKSCWQYGKMGSDTVTVLYLNLEDEEDNAYIEVNVTVTDGVISCKKVEAEDEITEDSASAENNTDASDRNDSSFDSKSAAEPVTGKATPQQMYREARLRLQDLTENFGLDAAALASFEQGRLCRSYTDENGQSYIIEEDESADSVMMARELEANGRYMVYHIIENNDVLYLLVVYIYADEWDMDRRNGDIICASIFGENGSEFEYDAVRISCKNGALKAERVGAAAEQTKAERAEAEPIKAEISSAEQTEKVYRKAAETSAEEDENIKFIRMDNGIPATEERIRAEARRRLDILAKELGLSLGIPRLFSEGEVYCSTTKLNGDPDCQPVKYFPSYYPAVQAQQKDTSCLVYHVIANGLSPYFLTVDRDETRWEQEKESGDIWPVCIYDTNEEDYHYEYRRLYSRDGVLFAEEITEEEKQAVIARLIEAEKAEEDAWE